MLKESTSSQGVHRRSATGPAPPARPGRPSAHRQEIRDLRRRDPRVQDLVPRQRRPALRDRSRRESGRPGRRERVALPAHPLEGDAGDRISQSGATTNLLAAVRARKGARTMDHERDRGSRWRARSTRCYTRPGLEVRVSTSKTFTAKIALIGLIALQLAGVENDARGTDRVRPRPALQASREDPAVPRHSHPMEEIAPRFSTAVLPLPRGHFGLPVARGRAEAEGVSYIRPGLFGRR